MIGAWLPEPAKLRRPSLRETLSRVKRGSIPLIALPFVLGSAAVVAAQSPEPTVSFVDGHTGETVEVPASWIEDAATSEAGEPEPEPFEPPTDLSNAELATARPTEWITPAVRRCRRYRGRRFCDGPLRAPAPQGEAGDRAVALGIGVARTAQSLLSAGPRPEWVAAVGGPVRESLQWPVDGGRIWRGLSRRRRGRTAHKGVDIGATTGTQVRAVNDALVVYANNELRGYGNLVVLVHADATVSLYAHLSEAWVFPGMRVLRGQILGLVGATGLARGAHLHFEWRRGGFPQDPVPRFVGRPEQTAQAPDGPVEAARMPSASGRVHEQGVNGGLRIAGDRDLSCTLVCGPDRLS